MLRPWPWSPVLRAIMLKRLFSLAPIGRLGEAALAVAFTVVHLDLIA